MSVLRFVQIGWSVVITSTVSNEKCTSSRGCSPTTLLRDVYLVAWRQGVDPGVARREAEEGHKRRVEGAEIARRDLAEVVNPDD